MEIVYIITIILLFAGSMYFLDRVMKRNDEKTKELMRELTKSLMARNIVEYQDSIPNDEPLPTAEADEFSEVDQISAEELLKSLQK